MTPNVMIANIHKRGIATFISILAVFGVYAQSAPASMGTPAFEVGAPLIYALVALAVMQVIFIVSLAGIMRTLGGPGGWIKKLVDRRLGRAVALAPLALISISATAQAYTGGDKDLSSYELFWLLVGVNLLLFIILMVQLRLVRSLTTVVTGATEPIATTAAETGPSWLDTVLNKLTRRASVEEEKDLELHHDYDGIRELDNVLPPWWLWLFYGTIIWGVVYVVNVHVIQIWPDSVGEYENEMVQAKADIDAYLATLTTTVDENTVTMTDDAGTLASGRELFTTFCTACHGADASGSETSVGPNLTDAFWLHGGGIKNVFKTIKYGVPEKGMISWKTQLQPAEIRAIACYIKSMAGKGGATQKAPQGEEWKEDGGVAPVDSAKVAVTQ